VPRSPSTYSLPPGTTPQQPNSVISSSMFNAFADDVAQTFNTVQPIVYGGTGSNDLKLTDTDFGIKDNGDPTKIGQFNASGLPPGTTRTYDLPYYSGTLGLVSDIRGQIYGLTLSNNVTDPTNDIDIAAGSAVDSTGVVSMLLASSLTKRLDAAWAVGNNQGGLDTGSVGNNVYYVWLIRRPDTGVVDVLFSLSNTAPTMPTNYTQKEIIGSFSRIAATNSAPRSYSQKEDTDWVQYTPTFEGFGTPTNISVWSKRGADTLYLRGRFTAGTVTAAEARLILGFNGVAGVVASSATKVTANQIAGSVVQSRSVAAAWYTLVGPGEAYIKFGIQTSVNAGISPAGASAIFATGDVISFTAEVPINGW
jgi:hypothetical protein